MFPSFLIGTYLETITIKNVIIAVKYYKLSRVKVIRIFLFVVLFSAQLIIMEKPLPCPAKSWPLCMMFRVKLPPLYVVPQWPSFASTET